MKLDFTQLSCAGESRRRNLTAKSANDNPADYFFDPTVDWVQARAAGLQFSRERLIARANRI